MWINSGFEAKFDDDKIVKDHRVRFVKGDGLEEASKDTVEIDEEEIVKQDFALINWEDAKKEETLFLVTENVLKAGTEFQEVVIDTGCTSDLAGRTWWMKFKNGMSAEDQEKVISTEGIKTYKFGAGESVRSMRKVGFPCVCGWKQGKLSGRHHPRRASFSPKSEDDERERIHH